MTSHHYRVDQRVKSGAASHLNLFPFISHRWSLQTSHPRSEMICDLCLINLNYQHISRRWRGRGRKETVTAAGLMARRESPQGRQHRLWLQAPREQCDHSTTSSWNTADHIYHRWCQTHPCLNICDNKYCTKHTFWVRIFSQTHVTFDMCTWGWTIKNNPILRPHHLICIPKEFY